MSETGIRLEGVAKVFAGVTALEDVTLAIARGECHCLVGENGAGKSTLGKILAGIHRPDAGQVVLDGRPLRLHSPGDALRAGIGMVHQELAFCPDLSIAENLCMGSYPRRGGWLIDRPAMRSRARSLLARIGATLDVDRPMRQLSTAQEQLVQIAAAIGTNARILIFDEPTSSLSELDAQRLLTLIEQLRRDGVTIVYVSHRMPEILRLADRVSVLRDGRLVRTIPRAEATADQVVRLMIGRSVESYFPRQDAPAPGEARLRVSGLSSPGRFREIGFEVRAGEIVGLAGLVGAGRSEVALAVFGLDPAASGRVELDGVSLPLGRVRPARQRGLAMLPEDRKRQGLVLPMSCLHNASLAMLDRLATLGFLQHRRGRQLASEWFDRLRVKTSSIHAPVGSLSGGNQQKVALAKWLARGCRVLIVDEPTRGVDVGAKAAIHRLLDDLAREGLAILLISSELPELIHLSTRVLVMRDGRLVRELPRARLSQERLLRWMSGVGERDEPPPAA